MDNRSCYVFLGDSPEKKEVLVIFCITDGYTKEEAKSKITEVLNKRNPSDGHKILYTGIIDYHGADPDIVGRQEDFFEKHDAVWIQRCSYNK